MNNKLDYLKVDLSKNEKEFEKKKFMDYLKDHPELLKNFSNDRLRKMLEYYTKENEEKRKIIEEKKKYLLKLKSTS